MNAQPNPFDSPIVKYGGGFIVLVILELPLAVFYGPAILPTLSAVSASRYAVFLLSAIIGISKTAMALTPVQFEVVREDEAPPLIVTCAGIDLGAAKARVRAMHGKGRVPTLLKLAARTANRSAGT